jgi:hypothetical protein
VLFKAPRLRRFQNSMDEVTEQFLLNGGSSSGTSFARKLHCSGTNLPGKDSARGRLVNLYDSDKWPMPLTILTMPGLKWLFENQLLQRRGKNGAQSRFPGHNYPKAPTHIVSVENENIIYLGALKFIPRDSQNSLKILSVRSVSTNFIHRYLAMDVEEYIESADCLFFDAAWIDFTGFVTVRRLEALKNFWHTKVGLHLTITSLAARWQTAISEMIAMHGSLGQMLAKTLDADVLNEFSYADGVTPMHQITLTKKNPSMQYFGYDPFPRDRIKELLYGSPAS